MNVNDVLERGYDDNPLKAMIICIREHDGQHRNYSKLPYSTHPISAVYYLKTEFPDYTIEEECATYLHDVVEDTEYTLNNLREDGFSDEVLDIVDFMTQREEVGYLDYIVKITKNKSAIRVKIADVLHNNSDQKDKTKRERYHLTLHILYTALENYASE